MIYKKGLTILEITIVLAIVSVLIAIALPQFSKIRENQVLKAATGDIVSALNKARAQTLASYDSSSYGVHFEADQVIIFKGTSYSSGDPDNEAISIVSPASITDVTLGGVSGSSGSVYFSRLYGSPNNSGSVTVSNSSSATVITISGTGTFSVSQ